jgi:hypothetical protein
MLKEEPRTTPRWHTPYPFDYAQCRFFASDDATRGLSVVVPFEAKRHHYRIVIPTGAKRSGGTCFVWHSQLCR